ncbi:MAG: hypothetical protein KKC42_01185 [Candidatus Omnitrophica bacterium]|nr:hypothetical protein [Candidatus Omnitrophota bacterium]
MRKNLVVGILRETNDRESRAPLTPSDVRWLVKRGITVEVEGSYQRIFSDQEYRRSGARVLGRFKKAEFLVGIKEPEPRNLNRNKIYMIFSHTCKGQFQNMELLSACLENKNTLVDYEKIVDLHGARIVFFGRFAGICGIIDSLYYLGKRLEWEGIKNPFLLLKPSYKYGTFKEVKLAMSKVDREIRKRGFARRLSPFIIGISGHGNVSRGVQEILEILAPVEIHPKDMLEFIRHQKANKNKIYKIVFLREEKFRTKDRKGFYFEEYLSNPEGFESNMDNYLAYLNILIHTSYWDARYPRTVTKKMIRKLSKKQCFRLEFIGDIACDINGSIELTYKTTSVDNPTFTFNPKTNKYIDGHKSPGVTVLAVDNLPAELPRDASGEFSSLIRDYIYQIAAHGVTDITRHIAIPAEIRRAVIIQNGKLVKNFAYLKKHL